MAKDSSTRKWQLTINNPQDKDIDFSHEGIRKIVDAGQACLYYCMADEIGENGTPHTHLFLCFSSAARFSTLQNKFSGAHFEMANGTCQQNRDYINKDGKWRNDVKHGTKVDDTFEEYGEMPIERQGARNDLADLFDAIQSGADDFSIIENHPSYLVNIDAINKTRQIVHEKQFRNTFRKLFVSYVCGSPGVGKTRGVMETFGYENCYRVTDYTHPFDGYRGQDVLIFEEFRNNLKLQDMLVYLDGYPVDLPARFMNKVACFTKVFIISNIPFEEQYSFVRVDNFDTYAAWLRRIHMIKIYNRDGTYREYPIQEYQQSFIPMDFIYCPFDKPYQPRQLKL